MLTVGLAAALLALLWPPTVSQTRMVAYLVTMLTVAVAVIMANVWVAARDREWVSLGRPLRPAELTCPGPHRRPGVNRRRAGQKWHQLTPLDAVDLAAHQLPPVVMSP